MVFLPGAMGHTASVDAVGDADGLDGEPRGPPTRTTRTHLICLSRAHNKFAINLYQEFAKDGKRPGNLMYSPLSIALGLGMTYLGADGSSLDELHKALHLHEVQEYHLLPAFAAMHWDMVRSSMPKGCVIEAAICLFAQTGHRVTHLYGEICDNYEIRRLRQVNFNQRPDLARNEINKWVEDKTQGRVKDALPLGIIDRDTRLFLICAIFIKVQWYHQFDVKKTKKGQFFLQMKETLEVNMMNQQNTFRYGTLPKLSCDAIELPCANGHVRMYIFLPHKQDGINKLENKLSRANIESLEDHLHEEYVDVYLPKFRYELGFSMNDVLGKLGVRDVFTYGRADLSKIDGTRDLNLSKVFHHVFIVVDEAGNESINVTSVHEVGGADAKVQKTFKADHPFFFYLRDDRTGAILFMGRVVRPALAS